MTTTYSTISGWMIPFTRAMEAHDIDVSVAMKACNIDDKVLKDQESRIAHDCFCALIDYCNEQLNTHDFAITVAKFFHPGTFHAVGYAMLSSNTLKDALNRIARYKRIVSNTCELNVQEHADNLFVEMKIQRYEDTNRLALSLGSTIAFLGTIVSFSKALAGKELNVKKILLCYHKPVYDTQFLEDYFNCEIEFDTLHSGIEIELETANKILIGANPLITQTHEKLLDEFLSRVDKNDLIQQVRSKIYAALPLGTPPQSEVAKELGMSLRNMQRKLKDKGSNYKEILEDTRKNLAQGYLKQAHLSLGEVSYLIGFSDLSNFNRAFKRWTNLTPGDYRQNYFN
jgi:AraC-like DNA-binding protein